MSKYSRTRKAICRISFLEFWIINRNDFKNNPSDTWKKAWNIYRKKCLKLENKRGNITKYRYKDLRKKHIDIWNYIPIF